MGRGAGRRAGRRSARRVTRRHDMMDSASAPPPEQPAAAPPPPAPAPAPAPAAETDMVAELKKLAELHDAGILTDDEFASAKAKLLG